MTDARLKEAFHMTASERAANVAYMRRLAEWLRNGYHEARAHGRTLELNAWGRALLLSLRCAADKLRSAR